ncbi:MAG: ABC transporter substrate-binding protein [Burkholderiales bacterium]|nr:ABC transporter substrate-binding protein [Burkholderiales bacterium]
MRKLLTLLLLVPAIAFAEAAPDVVIRDLAKQVTSIIKQEQQKKSDKKALAEAVDAKIMPHFDFIRMTKLAVGREWRTATPVQQKSLIDEFHTLLMNTYSSAIASYKNQPIEVLPLEGQPDGNQVMVHSRIIQQDKEPITVDYRMEKTANGWMIFDVSVEGISLVTNYRSTFQTEISNSGIDGLIRMLTDKNKKFDTKGDK